MSTTAAEKKPFDWSTSDTALDHDGKKIVLPSSPERMSITDGIKTLQRLEEQENQIFDVTEQVEGAPWDCLAAVYLAMKDIYGVVMAESIKSFFGEQRPDFITIKIGPNAEDVVQVPQGKIALPNVDKPIFVNMNDMGCSISGAVKRKDQSILIDIANKAREHIKTSSIYKGKAIHLNVDEDGDLVLSEQPEFLDLDKVSESDIIHNFNTEMMIKTNIFAPLKYTQACRDNNIPLKRGILLEGPFGCGKSMTARVTGKVATDNGWTFIMLNRSQGLLEAINFAKNYLPCVIFAEDIDRCADRSNEEVNDLVNLLDGVVSKDMELMTVLTTNFIEKIDRALLRPGRFDAVINIGAPDANTAQRVIRAYAADLLPADADLNEVGETIAGFIPASIREVVERAKLSMLLESRDHITAADLQFSATSLRAHMDLLAAPKIEPTDAELFTRSFFNLIEASGAAKADALDAASRKLTEIGNNAVNYSSRAASNASLGVVLGQRTMESVGEVASQTEEIHDAVVKKAS